MFQLFILCYYYYGKVYTATQEPVSKEHRQAKKNMCWDNTYMDSIGSHRHKSLLGVHTQALPAPLNNLYHYIRHSYQDTDFHWYRPGQTDPGICT